MSIFNIPGLRGAVGLLAASLILLGCVSSKPRDFASLLQLMQDRGSEEQQLVRTAVADPARAAVVLDLLSQRDGLAADYGAAMTRYEAALRSLDRSYDASRQDFDQLLGDFNATRREFHRAMVELTAEMKAATTEAEWKSLAAFHLKGTKG
jgi:hypothetical protein